MTHHIDNRQFSTRKITRHVLDVAEHCRKNGLDRVTVEELERIRARMPTPKIFGTREQEKPTGD